MNQLQYIEESKMTFEERLRLAFGMYELSKALSSQSKDFEDDDDIEWVTLRMISDQSL